jgi:thiol-disulfide isomerase/thioredoxin
MKKHLFSAGIALLAMLAGLNAQSFAQKPGQGVQADNPEYLRLIDHLGTLGQRIVKSNQAEELFALTMEEVETLDRLIGMSRPEEKEGWIRQLADCLVSAALEGPKNDLRAVNRMSILRANIDQSAPGSALASYVGFQQLQIEHARLVEQPHADAANVQQAWRHLLANYVNAYPHASETAKALVELATLSEAAGKDEDARRCYRFMIENRPETADIEKAQGALKRLNLMGQEFHLALPVLKEDTGSDEPFDIETLKGHVVLVYFWSATNEHCLAEIQQLAGIAADRRCQLVCVNCDASPAAAVKLMRDHQIGIQLHQRDGINGHLSHRIGIFDLPQLMVVSKEGRVISKGTDVANAQRIVADHLSDPAPEIIRAGHMSTSRWLTIGK